MNRLWQFRGRVHDLGMGLVIAAAVQLFARLVPGDGAVAVGLAGWALVMIAGVPRENGPTDGAASLDHVRAA